VSGQRSPETGMPGEPTRSLVERLRDAWELEFGQFRPRLFFLGLLARPLPRNGGNRLRVKLLRAMGCTIGEGTRVLDLPQFTGGTPDLGRNLIVGVGTTIDWGCSFELGEKLTIGDRVRLGPEVLILTTTHELGAREHRAGPLVRMPVNVGSDATIGARAVVLPGVTIGEGARILAGSVVNKNVPPHGRWGGIPAKPVGQG
jgi:maltose O-acetyltransferase